MLQLSTEVKNYIDTILQNNPALRDDYTALREDIAQRFGVNVSKPAISRRAGRLNIKARRGRKPSGSAQQRLAHSRHISYAGAFFLKGAELETGMLTAINRLLVTKTKSLRAERALRLARAINAYLLYLPLVAGGNPSTQRGPLLRVPPHGRTTEAPRVLPVRLHLRTDRDVRGMLCLTGQKRLPGRREIKQYLDFLDEQGLWPLMVDEIEKSCREALRIRVQTPQGTFYLDAQGRTVWPAAQIPQCFSTTLNKAIAYVDKVFLHPFVRRALALQAVHGDTFLPQEVVNLIQCFEPKEAASTCCLTILDELGNRLVPDISSNFTLKKYFIFPLNTQQAAQFCEVRDVQQYQKVRIGTEKEALRVAGARADLFTNAQHTESIGVRAIIVEREEEKMVLVTNIPSSVERYAGQIAEQFFYRWPLTSAKSPLSPLFQRGEFSGAKSPLTPLLQRGEGEASAESHLYPPLEKGGRGDLLQQADEEAGYLLPLQEAKKAALEGKADYPSTQATALSRGPLPGVSLQGQTTETPRALPVGIHFFQLLLECLHRYAQTHFFPAESGGCLEQICRQGGYARVTRKEQKICLYPFQDNQLQQITQTACRNFNQSIIELPTQTALRLFVGN